MKRYLMEQRETEVLEVLHRPAKMNVSVWFKEIMRRRAYWEARIHWLTG